MATLAVEGADLVVRLSPLEKLGSLRGDLRMPLAAVRSATVEPEPWPLVRGMRLAGAGVPGVIALGTRRYRGGKDFTAVYGRRPVVRVELAEPSPFTRLLVRVASPEQTAAMIQPASR
jgi:hypothetical protein